MYASHQKMNGDIIIVSNKVLWTFENRTIAIEIEDAFFVSERKEMQLIEIESGKNFKQSKVFYFNFAGELVLYYDLETGTIEWSLQGNVKKIAIENMKQVGFFPQEQRIFIISSCEKQELLGYDIEGKILFKVNNPPEYKMLYFTKLKSNVIVVRDGGKSNEDKYNRFRHNFFMDINTGKLTKGGLAY